MTDSFQYTMTEKAYFARTVKSGLGAGARALKRCEIETDPVLRLGHLARAFESLARCRRNLDNWPPEWLRKGLTP